MPQNPPVPSNEFSRVLDLSELDLDYSDLNDKFQDLTQLAARVAGTEVSLLNLIDTFTQWTVSSHGFTLDQMPREDSVCQYTIMEPEQFEVKDLSRDDRFKDKFYVKDQPNLKFYFGIPLINKKGNSIGALCVLDKEQQTLSPEKVELLKIIASEIVNRLMMLDMIRSLSRELHEAKEVKKRVAHDIRGPIGGIIGLAQLISERGDKNQLKEVLQFISLIHKSGTSLLDLADEILSSELKPTVTKPELSEHELNLQLFKVKLEKLYHPQALNKNIDFTVRINPENAVIPFPKNKLLQITGNLISNAVKFTPENGKITVEMDLMITDAASTLHIKVSDSGVGLDQKSIDNILNGESSSTSGTTGEKGYGFGLPLVKHLVHGLHGAMDIQSEENKGTAFSIKVPVK